MTTITCSGYRATSAAGGQIRLEIENPSPDALEGQMYLDEIATALKKSVKQIDKLSRRKRNPLPLIRGNGRPYTLRSRLNEWLRGGNLKTGKGKFPAFLGGMVAPGPVFRGEAGPVPVNCRCGSTWPAGPGNCYCPECQP